MKIGSLKKTTLLDFPGKIAAVIGTQGCNMCCPWCHNYYLIPCDFTKRSQIIRQEELIGFLDQRKKFLDGIVITGGEPTIQSDLPQLCERVKRIGLAVKIDTNGTHPDMLKSLLKNDLVDYIAMDIKTDLNQYQHLFRKNISTKKIHRSIDMIMSSGRPYEFRTTCVSPFVTKDNIDQIGKLIKGAKSFFLQKCHLPEKMDEDYRYKVVDDNLLIELKRRVDSYVEACKIR